MDTRSDICQPARTKKEKARSTTLRPLVDLFEQNEELLLVADLPGVLESDLQLKVEGRTLSLEAKGTDLNGDEVVYARSFVLPAEVTAQGAKAQLQGGVLKLHLPRHEQSRSHRIPVVSA